MNAIEQFVLDHPELRLTIYTKSLCNVQVIVLQMNKGDRCIRMIYDGGDNFLFESGFILEEMLRRLTKEEIPPVNR